MFSQSNFQPEKRFDKLVERVKYYDEIGIDTLWISDGLLGGADPSVYPHYETMELISALSQHTSKVKFGTLVSPFTLRPVSLYSKMITTLYHLTGSRFIAGLGVGNPSQTTSKQGIPGMDLKERIEMFEEYIETLRSLLKSNSVTNQLLDLDNFSANPLAKSETSLKLLIAGNGEKRTLRQVAKYADMSNIWGDNNTLQTKLSVLAKWCDEVERPFNEIENTTMRAVVTGGTDELIESDIKWYMNRFKELGRPIPSREDFEKDRLVGSVETIVTKLGELKELGIQHTVLTINTENTRSSISSIMDEINQI